MGCVSRARHPDLILMDIHLPGMNGIDAIKVLRADTATSKIRVVAITASVMQQDTQQITRAGFDGFIEKPIDLRIFLATVQQAIRAGDV
jgi:two-component system cell cycle response regulator DivK